MNAWEINVIPDEKLQQYDAAILLTGMSTYDIKNKRLEFNDRTDRLLQTIKLYKNKKINKIVLCGGPATISGNDKLEADELKQFMLKLGIPAEDLIVESISRNTHENAVNIQPILENTFPNGKFLLVSSAWHLRRAAGCFEKQGIKVIPYSTDRYSGPVKYELDYFFLPSSATLFNWEKLLHEWVGIVVYKIFGYV
jgi:uncharacterized SAM-binding protein YcdF (DUF218 family)